MFSRASSLFGPTISISPPTLPGEVLEASDASTLSGGVTLAAGSSVGLGHVLFDVSPSAPNAVVSVTFTAFPFTNLSDPLDNNIPITSLASGDIDIQGSVSPAVPEPSMFVIFAIGTGLVAVYRFVSKWEAYRDGPAPESLT